MLDSLTLCVDVTGPDPVEELLVALSLRAAAVVAPNAGRASQAMTTSRRTLGDCQVTRRSRPPTHDHIMVRVRLQSASAARPE